MKAPGEGATQLPWLCPCAASLLALTRAPGEEVWSEVRTDPGCVLLLVRFALPRGVGDGHTPLPSLLRDADALDAARSFLSAGTDAPGWVDWDSPVARPIHEAALAYAHLSAAIAVRSGRYDPEWAWVAGLLAPLGAMALCAERTEALAWPCRQLGSLSPAIARRLCRCWRLPLWLAAAAGHLALPVEIVKGLGADPELFEIVQLAVALVEQKGRGIGLHSGRSVADLCGALGLNRREVEELGDDNPRPSRRWERPHDLPLLSDLLRLAAENRRLGDLPVLERVQDEFDVLHAALEEQLQGEVQRLKEQKLSALAELAAGAGHEINNPLAVISGQAQYLLRKLGGLERQAGSRDGAEEESADGAAPERKRPEVATSLQTIISQTQRIHQLVNDLMQFARPPAPQRQLVDVAGLVRDVAAALQGLADERAVHLVCPEPQLSVSLYADPAQVARALTGLLRNAVEAAPAQGWAGVRVEQGRPDRLDLIVEDSGRGPLPADREHLFDPFYSGRQAGRGRGLGLPTAWRIARQHGGDVRFVQAEHGVTRFVLSLPLSAEPAVRGLEAVCGPAQLLRPAS
jgi:signal transduction histidine kinase